MESPRGENNAAHPSVRQLCVQTVEFPLGLYRYWLFRNLKGTVHPEIKTTGVSSHLDSFESSCGVTARPRRREGTKKILFLSQSLSLTLTQVCFKPKLRLLPLPRLTLTMKQ